MGSIRPFISPSTTLGDSQRGLPGDLEALQGRAGNPVGRWEAQRVAGTLLGAGGHKRKPLTEERKKGRKMTDTVVRQLSEKFGIRPASAGVEPVRRKTGKKRRQMYSHMHKMMEKGGFLLLWLAVGLDLIISISGSPILGQAVSASIVIMYLLYNVHLKKLVCSFWFTVIDFFFREISVGGETKLEALRDGRAVIFCVAPHVNQFIGSPPLPSPSRHLVSPSRPPSFLPTFSATGSTLVFPRSLVNCLRPHQQHRRHPPVPRPQIRSS